MWTAGDYGEVAQRIVPVGEYVAQRAGAAPGRRAARRRDRHGQRLGPGRAGGRDRDRARPDAQAARASSASGPPPPASRSSSSRATPRSSPSARHPSTASRSCFGVMFAPRQRGRRRRARPRGARPGGEIVVAAWTPEGDRRADVPRPPRRYMPPPPEGFRATRDVGQRGPRPWAVRGQRRELSFELRTITFEGDSVEAWVEKDERILGPSVMAKAALEQQGRYEELRRDCSISTGVQRSRRTAAFRAAAEYLVTVGRSCPARARRRSSESSASSSSTTSPRRRTAAIVVERRRALRDDRDRAARRRRSASGQPGDRVHLERRADAQQQLGALAAARCARSHRASGSSSPNSTTSGFSGSPQLAQRGTPSASPRCRRAPPPARTRAAQREAGRSWRSSRAPRPARAMPARAVERSMFCVITPSSRPRRSSSASARVRAVGLLVAERVRSAAP